MGLEFLARRCYHPAWRKQMSSKNNVAKRRFVKSHSRSGAGPVVVQLVPALGHGGVERGTIEVARAITDAGGRAVVISAGGTLMRRLERAGATHHTIDVGLKNPLRWRGLRRQVGDVLRREGADIVHVRSRVPAWIALGEASAQGITTISTVHGRFQASNALKRKYNGKLLASDHVIAISNHVRNQIETQYGAMDGKLTVIQRGVDIDIFDPAAVNQPRVVRLMQMLAFPADEPVIMLPARPSLWKGHEVLLKALALIKHRKFHCVLVGAADGKQAFINKLAELGRSLGLESRFRLTGGVDDMPAALMSADIVVMPSVTPEPFGRVAVEAQAMGRLVIAFDHGGAAESIVDGQTGWLAKAVDEQSLATCLGAALDMSAKQRSAMAVRTRSHIVENFSTARMCRSTINVYRRLLAKRFADGA